MAGVFYARRMAIACDIGTEGTFTSGNVAIADATIPVYDATLATTLAQFDRTPARGSILGHSSSVPGARYGTLTFSMDLKGSGTAGTAPQIGKLLRACGMSETIVPATSVAYAISNGAHSVLDIAFYNVDGDAAFRGARFHSARGSWTATFENGVAVRLNFTFMGVWNDAAGIVDSTAWVTTQLFDNTAPPAFKGVTLTVGGSSIPCFTTCNIDLAAQLAMRGCAAEATGYKAADITGFNPTFGMNPLAQLAATYNPYSQMIAGTLAALSLGIGSTAGNIVTITAPKFQVSSIAQQLTDDMLRDQITGRLSAGESDDYIPLTVTFT